MNRCPTVLTFVLLAVPAGAQTLSMTITTATPMVAQVSSSGPLVTSGLPIQTIGSNSLLASDWSGTVRMSSQWWSQVGTTECNMEWNQEATVSVPAPAFARTDPSDLLLHVQSSTAPFVPIPITLELSRSLAASAGSTLPVHRIDIGDDGSFEFTESSPAWGTMTGLVVGPQGLTIRLRTQVGQTGAGAIALGLRVRVLPDNGLIVQPTVPGCSADELWLLPTFAGSGIELITATANHPVFAVIGFHLQPQFLSPLFPAPCLLLPSPDVVMHVPTWPPVVIPLPAAVRPLSFSAQGVALTPNGPATTLGYQVWRF